MGGWIYVSHIEGSDDSAITAFGIRRVTRLSKAKTSFVDSIYGARSSNRFKLALTKSQYKRVKWCISGHSRASSEEGGSKTPHVRRSNTESRAPVSKESVEWKKAINEEMVSLEKNQMCSLVRISAKKKASQKLWMFKEPSYVGALNDTSTQHKSEGFQLAGQEENLECILKEILYGLTQAPRQCDVHQVGDEIEVEVLRSFN
ncbi:hypothetical protein Tco_0877531 [Tanacetum coccineum]|uniref:Uncharacterized protein n=1 Tax=Tanacetum coccineum TaxID=301880 RepID=A0ABQ5BVC3_9ASTR